MSDVQNLLRDEALEFAEGVLLKDPRQLCSPARVALAENQVPALFEELTHAVAVTLGKSSTITAAGRVDLAATSDTRTEAKAYSKGGGVLADADSKANATLNVTSKVGFGEKSKVRAGGALTAKTDYAVDALSEAQSFSGAAALYAGAYANYSGNPYLNGTDGTTITANSTIEVAKGALIEAETVDLHADASRLEGKAKAGAQSFLVLLIGASPAYAEANANVDADVQVLIDAEDNDDGRTSITGRRGVDLQATYDTVKFERLAGRLAVGLIPPQGAFAGGITTVDARVESKGSATITAGPRAGGALDDPDADLKALARSQTTAKVSTHPHPRDETETEISDPGPTNCTPSLLLPLRPEPEQRGNLCLPLE